MRDGNFATSVSGNVRNSEECVADVMSNQLVSNCNFATSGLRDVGTYINNEGNIEMQESKCDIHLAACQGCNISNQVSPADKI